MAAYPQQPFKQADSLLTGLIDSYRCAADAQDIADIQSLVETTVKIARDREYRVHDDIRELSQKVTDVEAAAVYSDAKAKHEKHMREMNEFMAQSQQAVHLVNDDIKGTSDQKAELQLQQKKLLADKQELHRLQQTVEPDKLQRISMYVHITGLAFDYNTLEAPVTHGTVSDAINGDIRAVTMNTATMDFDSVNKLWSEFAQPVMQ